MICWRSASEIAPTRLSGGAILARSTGIGEPLSSNIDTSALPTASSEITRSTSSEPSLRKV